MRRSILILAAMMLAVVLCGSAFAAQAASSGGKTEVDGMLSIATDPGALNFGGSFGTTWGLGAGLGFDLSDRLKPSSGRIFGRVDINYFKWDESVFGISASYTRVPVFVGGRYYLPTSGSNVGIFVEAGLEFSYDKQEFPIPFFFGLKTSTSDVNIGLTPGAGIEIPISNDGLFIGGDARWHIIDNDYFTLSLVLGKKF